MDSARSRDMLKDIDQVVCATDFSDLAAEGVRVAVQVAELTGAELVLVHAIPVTSLMPRVPVPEPPVDFDVARYIEYRVTEAAAALRDVAASIPPGVTVHTTVEEGDPASEIVRVAKERDAGLVVIATHGRSGFVRWVMGSVAEKVVRTSPVLVLTVPAREES